jgi:type I site-specific restriction-modification system R (restriction) subunit
VRDYRLAAKRLYAGEAVGRHPANAGGAFTDIPLIVVKEKKITNERFDSHIEKYKDRDAINDNARVQVFCEGKTAASAGTEVTFDEKLDEMAAKHVKEYGKQKMSRFCRKSTASTGCTSASYAAGSGFA